MSHSTHSGFSAMLSSSGFSRAIICADRLDEGLLFRYAEGFRVDRKPSVAAGVR